ncbi:hypothetical protein Ahy_A07g034218 isoform B [Arachis hypogaea]|uniref:Uncharacterized protein n=1 Tax=Arachis hypogaea TaxID=3818 RepID=A0A445CB99_ARAHY|nr:hypothetical protein Ahy_A07g034218 isoform B [Arachis hypogaea]
MSIQLLEKVQGAVFAEANSQHVYVSYSEITTLALCGYSKIVHEFMCSMKNYISVVTPTLNGSIRSHDNNTLWHLI